MFWYTEVFTMQQPETGRPVRVFFLFEGNVRYNEQKKYKRDDNVSEKKTVTLSHFFIQAGSD